MLGLSGCVLFNDPSPSRPNVLFIVLDDVGIDQFRKFGYGGADAPRTPVMDLIAQKGVMFNNVWSMPECSPSRAMFFNGRYPSRTNINSAILSADLANSQLSPYEYTTPKVLNRAGYESALFGKAHFSGSPINPANNPYGNTAPAQLGWDRFDGWFDGAPKPIDTTAGGVAAAGTYSCGFVPDRSTDPAHGADSGACYTANGQCSVISAQADAPVPGQACLERGGILVPNAACAPTPPSYLNFKTENGYYASERLINRRDGSSHVIPADDPSGAGRRYRTQVETDAAIDWIRSRPAGRPWMATVSFSSAHAPYQPPPNSMLPAGTPPWTASCAGEVSARPLFKRMIESIDADIGRLLVDAGLARRQADGSLDYDPAKTDTMIVIIGDNGSYAFTVKAPFDFERAKGFVNQTGVWVPLTIAGPLVVQPGRWVESMVNVADLYELFAEIANLNLRDVVPASRALDSASLLPYLTNPAQAPIREYNFTEASGNIRDVTIAAAPCVIESVGVCTTLFPQKKLCEYEGGRWYGPSPSSGALVTNPSPSSDGGFASCCALNKALQDQGLAAYGIMPDRQQAIRNRDYKLIRLLTPTASSSSDSCPSVESFQFFRVDQARPLPRIDRPGGPNDLGTTALAGQDLTNFNLLMAELQRVNASVVPCNGDGNADGVIDALDLAELDTWVTRTNGKSTWFDVNLDGRTDSVDRNFIATRLGTRCGGPR